MEKSQSRSPADTLVWKAGICYLRSRLKDLQQQKHWLVESRRILEKNFLKNPISLQKTHKILQTALVHELVQVKTKLAECHLALDHVRRNRGWTRETDRCRLPRFIDPVELLKKAGFSKKVTDDAWFDWGLIRAKVRMNRDAKEKKCIEAKERRKVLVKTWKGNN